MVIRQRKQIIIDRAQVAYTVVIFDPIKDRLYTDADYQGSDHTVHADRELFNKGMVTEPGSILIDQSRTTELLGRPAGVLPEDALRRIHKGSLERGELIAILCGHSGWQYGEAATFNTGKGFCHLAYPTDLLRHDIPDGSIFLSRHHKWAYSEDIAVGRHTSASVIMTGPRIVRDGRVATLTEYVDSPRIWCDARNIVDFSSGKPVYNGFFQDIRKVPFSTAERVRQLVHPSMPTFEFDFDVAATDRESILTLRDEAARLDLDFRLAYDGESATASCIVIRSFPRQRMPLMGHGVTKRGKLVTIAVDGRQPGYSLGCTIEQLAELLRKEGAIDAILTSGGNDVAILHYTWGRTYDAANQCWTGYRDTITPINRISTADGEARPIPYMLVISPNYQLFSQG